MQTRTVLSRLIPLALAAFAFSCSSEQPSDSTNQPVQGPCVLDGWQYTECSDPATRGMFVGECNSGDGLWVYSNCSMSSGPCRSADNNYSRTNCMDPSTQTWIGPGPAPTTGIPTSTPPAATPPSPPVQPTAPSTTGPAPLPVPPGSTGVVPPAPTDSTGVPPTTPTVPGTADPNVPPPVDPTAPVMTGEPPAVVPTPEGRTCPVYEGLIADFEEGSLATLPIEGRLGLWEGFDDGVGTRTDAIVEEGTDACNKGVLHTSGTGFESYVGIGTTVASSGLVTRDGKEEYAPVAYDAEALGFVGVSFRAKGGANQKYGVRFAVSTPWTEGPPYGDGTCVDAEGEINPCWDHLGHFLIDDEALGSDWQTYTLCFDRDYYPEWLPSGGTPEQRRAVGASMLGIQFKFNQAIDPATYPPSVENAVVSRAEPFDFYLDDIRLVKSGCEKPVFASTDGATDAFGTNSNLGTCAPATDAANYNSAIGAAYVRWRDTYVQADGGVVSPEQNGVISSEAISYGMMISAAVGDKPTFDKVWGWAKSKTNNGTALLGWNNGGGGSATDADIDIPYALLMADKQWGGYLDAAKTMAGLARSSVVDGSNLFTGGSQYTGVYNPSYFAPGYLRALEAAGAGSWASVISANYSKLNECDSSFSGADGIVSDWCGTNANAQVTSEVCPAGADCSAYDAARVPYRMGYDACVGGSEGQAMATKMTATFLSKSEGGRIDLLKAGMDASGMPTTNSVNNEMAFIGTVGVGAMGAGDDDTRDRAFRTTLDLIERPEYYNTYYSTSLGLMTLLMMSGNWPVP
jgi:endo-1,4-beta-D-glucanase Y